jgi:hypothetical protein
MPLRIVALVSTAVLLAALAGCASSSGEVAATAPEADGGTFGTVEALKDAFASAGGSCDNWATDDTPSLTAAQAGSCGGLSFFTYVSESDKQEYVTYFRNFSDDGPNSILIGENWIVLGTTDKISQASKYLGGVVQDSRP